MNLVTIVIAIVAMLGSALIGGVFFAFSSFSRSAAATPIRTARNRPSKENVGRLPWVSSTRSPSSPSGPIRASCAMLSPATRTLGFEVERK